MNNESMALAPASEVKTPQKDFTFILGIMPKTLAEAMEIAKVIAGSDLVPKDFKGKPENILIAWEMCQVLGIPAIQGLQNIAVINSRGTIWGELATAIVRSHPLTEYLNMPDLEEVKKTGRAWVVHKRRNEPMEHRYSYSIEDAKEAGLWGKQGTWTNYRYWMLQMRANSFLYKLSAADMLKGMAVTEEVRDFINLARTEDSYEMPKPKSEPAASAVVAPEIPAAMKPEPEKKAEMVPIATETPTGTGESQEKVILVTKSEYKGEPVFVIRFDGNSKKFLTKDMGVATLARDARDKGFAMVLDAEARDGADWIVSIRRAEKE